MRRGQPTRRTPLGLRAEVKFTSARMRRYKLAEVCPTSVSSRNLKLNEDDVTDSSYEKLGPPNSQLRVNMKL